MSNERLAELFQSYSIPCDKSLVDFKNAHKKELAWSEIAISNKVVMHAPIRTSLTTVTIAEYTIPVCLPWHLSKEN